MELSTTFMSNVLGAIGIVLYLVAPFLEDNKRAFYARLLSQFFLGLMFFYIGCLAGVSYYVVLLLSGLLQKQIEQNKTISIIYGIIGMLVTIFLNNTGTSGIILAVSIILIFLPIEENKMLMTTSYIDILTTLALAYYSISVKVWLSLIFSILLLLVSIAGLVSNIQLARAGGLKAAQLENLEYQKKKPKKKKK